MLFCLMFKRFHTSKMNDPYGNFKVMIFASFDSPHMNSASC